MIKSPYNFVPLNEHVYLPCWAKDISHDIPFEDGEDGWIEVVWHSCSPLFIRDTSTSDDKAKNVYSMHVKQADGSRLYFMPGSSLKGMLRSVMSIMSFGKMECDKESNRVQYNNSFFGYRVIASKNKDKDQKAKSQDYQKRLNGMRFGWLKKIDERYLLSPCDGEASYVSIAEVESKYPGYKFGKSAWERNDRISKGCAFPSWREGDTVYRLVATGKMDTKRHELLLPKATFEPITLDDETVEKFLSVYAPTPDFDKFVDKLEKGDDIPVGYVPNGRKKDGIDFVGMGKMMRVPYKYGVKDLVEKVQKPDSYKGGRDLCEAIFGWSDADSAMKGRVQICNAYATQPVQDSRLMEASGVLGEPRASFYPLYIKQTGSAFYNYNDDKAEISGRKRYRVHKGSSVMPLPAGNDNENTKSTMRFVPSGCDYVMRINVHNLRKVEIGALLSAITLHSADESDAKVWHNIGCAKSFGYGKITAASVRLHGLKWDKREYMAEYETTMDDFVQSHYSLSWLSSEQMTTLMGIMSEHEDYAVGMMELDEYGECKKNVDTVSKDFRSTKSLVDDDVRARHAAEAFRFSHHKEYDHIDALVLSDNDSDLRQACQMLETLKAEKAAKGIDFSEDDKMLTGIQVKRDGLEKAKQDALEEAKNKERQQRIGLGLESFLNETYTDGPNAGSYKVGTWKMCKSKVDKWLKDKGSSSLDSQEVDALKDVVMRLMANPDKKEKRDWGNAQSKLWKEIKKYLSEQDADSLFDGANT